MKWLRPTTQPEPSEEAVEEVAAQLSAAAHEAPVSHRAEEIRAALLEEVATDRGALPGLAPLALAAGALLLALAVGVGAPAVGSFIGDLIDRVPSTDEAPSGPDATDADVPEVPMPTDAETPTRRSPLPTVLPSDSSPAGGGDYGGSGSGASDAPTQIVPATPAPPATIPATPSPTPTPTAPPTPWPPSAPPQPVPTPPAIAPTPGPPGG